MRVIPVLAGAVALLLLAAPVATAKPGHSGGPKVEQTATTLQECADQATSHGQYVRCVAHLQSAGLLVATETGPGNSDAAHSCTGRSDEAKCEARLAAKQAKLAAKNQ